MDFPEKQLEQGDQPRTDAPCSKPLSVTCNEQRGEPFSALLSYARALRSDRKIFGKKILIERIEALAGEIEFHKLRSAAGRFAGTPAGMYLQAALAARERQEKPLPTCAG